ncbi:MAG: hypothetical protein ACRD4S_15960 [Candidatus Acidiferrales bacterium]
MAERDHITPRARQDFSGRSEEIADELRKIQSVGGNFCAKAREGNFRTNWNGLHKECECFVKVFNTSVEKFVEKNGGRSKFSSRQKV